MENKRTRNVKNEVIRHSDYYEMKMLNKDSYKKCYFDICDYELVTQFIWKMDRQGYVYTLTSNNGKKRRIVMHRLILDVLDDKCLVDHQDLNKSNNRRGNIRIATKSKNEMNKPLTKSNKSGVRGISFRKDRGTWVSEIKVDNTMSSVRIRESFQLFDNAIKHRIVNEANLFSEFSPNYNPLTNTIQLSYLSHDDNLQTFIEVDLQGNIINFKKLIDKQPNN